MHISVIGAGSWGTALAAAAARNGHHVLLYARQQEAADLINQQHINQRYLPQVKLPENLRATADLAQANAHVFGSSTDFGLALLATPVAGLRAAAQALVQTAGSRPFFAVWVCKGFEQGSGLMPHQVIQQAIEQYHAPGAMLGVLSGPSFALEVAQDLPVALTVASTSTMLKKATTHAFHGRSLRVYSSQDVVGVEVGGAVKNVMAIATGIADGLQLGLNARAALITRGLAEMTRLGVALGAQPETFTGLTGLGDLVLTATGDLSRNRKVGLGVAAGQSLEQIQSALGQVAEGVRCAQTVDALARQHNVQMPITHAVCRVLFEGLSPKAAVTALLGRDPRAEAE